MSKNECRNPRRRMTKTTTLCDICGIEKKANNHWWAVRLNHPLNEIRFQALVGNDESSCVCGEKCAMVALGRFLSDPSKDPFTSLEGNA